MSYTNPLYDVKNIDDPIPGLYFTSANSTTNFNSTNSTTFPTSTNSTTFPTSTNSTTFLTDIIMNRYELRIAALAAEPQFLPKRAHSTDAGADLKAYITSPITIAPGEQVLVDTGVAVKIPAGYAGFVYNRSSQGKRGIILPNSVGVIDSDYRGNILVLLKNIGTVTHTINRGDKIAQLVVQPVVLADFCEIWHDTQRGTGGFGSTGT